MSESDETQRADHAPRGEPGTAPRRFALGEADIARLNARKVDAALCNAVQAVFPAGTAAVLDVSGPWSATVAPAAAMRGVKW